jgi:uncharacterized protein (TIGR02145 family)
VAKLAKRTFLAVLLLLALSCGGDNDGITKPPVEQEPSLIIPESTKTLSSSTLNNITYYDGGTGTIVFSARNSQTDSISLGDILVGGISEETSKGFLGKVNYISANRDTIKTTQATLVEAIEKGEFNLETKLVINSVGNQTPQIFGAPHLNPGSIRLLPSLGDFGFGIEISNFLFYDGDGNINTVQDQIVGNGLMYFNHDIEVDIDIDGFRLERFLFQNTVSNEFDLSLIAGRDVFEVDERISIVFPDLPSIPIPPVPIWVTPNIQVNIGIKGKSSDLEVRVSQQGSFTASVSYDGVSWKSSANSSVDFNFEIPVLTANTSLKGFAGPQLNLFIYDVAAPTIGINGYAKLEADVTKDPWWQLYGGLEATIGVKARVLGFTIVDYSKDVINVERILAEAEEPPPVDSVFVDPRDGQSYKIVRIEDQTWMAENLNYNGLCYGLNTENCEIYGSLYRWPRGNDLCPSEWHLPSNDEWDTLINFLGGANIAGGKLKETGTTHWNSPNTGATDESGFTALPAGFSLVSNFNRYFYYLGNRTVFWTSTRDSDYQGQEMAFVREMTFDKESISNSNSSYALPFSLSVRCVKNQSQ